MRLTQRRRSGWWPTPRGNSTLPDVCFETDLAGLRLQFLGGLDMDRHPVLYDTEDEAVEDAKNRLFVRRVASRSGSTAGCREGEVVHVTLHGKDGTVLFEGEVR